MVYISGVFGVTNSQIGSGNILIYILSWSPQFESGYSKELSINLVWSYHYLPVRNQIPKQTNKIKLICICFTYPHTCLARVACTSPSIVKSIFIPDTRVDGTLHRTRVYPMKIPFTIQTTEISGSIEWPRLNLRNNIGDGCEEKATYHSTTSFKPLMRALSTYKLKSQEYKFRFRYLRIIMYIYYSTNYGSDI